MYDKPGGASELGRTIMVVRVLLRGNIVLLWEWLIHMHTHKQCLGIVALSVGLRLYIANNEYATFSEGRDLLGSVFLIAVGFGVVIVGFLGIVAAIWESTIIATCVS